MCQFFFEKPIESERSLFNYFPELFGIKHWKLNRIIRQSKSDLSNCGHPIYHSKLLRNSTWAYADFLVNFQNKTQCFEMLNTCGFPVHDDFEVQQLKNTDYHLLIKIVEYECDFWISILTNSPTVTEYLFANRFEISPPWIFCPEATPDDECFEEYRGVNYWNSVHWEPFWNSMDFTEQYNYLKRYQATDIWFNFLTKNKYINKIQFYRTGDLYGEFSNFAAYPIEIDGEVWPTSEHYFQAQKFSDKNLREKIRLDANPMNAARLGRLPDPSFVSDWDLIKDSVMQRALYAKFTQHESLKELLLSTENSELIEHTKNDSYWADGGDGQGLNKLGCFLMDIRETMRIAQYHVPTISRG